MPKISTQHLAGLPDIQTLQRLCQSLATLEAVICREWQYRYYSYDRAWNLAKNEACFHMRNGSGDEFKILFSPHGAVINGLDHESVMNRWVEKEIPPTSLAEKLGNIFGKKKTVSEPQIWPGVVDTVPDEFKDFVFGQPIKSIGTTFCIWRTNQDTKWSIGNIQFPKDKYGDGSEDMLYILDGNPVTYQKWATEYYEEQFEKRPLRLDLVKHVYGFLPLTREVILGLNPDLEDFDELKNDLAEIGYEHDGL
jgi:hypothetical protein